MYPIRDDKLFRSLTHLYVFCSFLASLLLLASVDVAKIFYTIGASSGYIAFGVATSESINFSVPVGLVAMSWAILFPALLLIAYILSLKNHSILICVIMILDAVVVAAWVVFAYIIGNEYGEETFLADAVVSIIYSALFLWVYKKTKDRVSA